jgi:hypothetical protein
MIQIDLFDLISQRREFVFQTYIFQRAIFGQKPVCVVYVWQPNSRAKSMRIH